MRHQVIRLLLLLLPGMLTIVSCSKDNTGPKGDQGIQGPKGDQGEPGKNADVRSTGNILINESQWVTADSLEWFATIQTTVVTQDVMNAGSVQVYILSGAAWQSLPLFDHTVYTTYAYEPGKVRLIHADSHGNLPAKPGTATFKVVTVSAGQ